LLLASGTGVVYVAGARWLNSETLAPFAIIMGFLLAGFGIVRVVFAILIALGIVKK
jgi:hypothetical protein